MTETLNATAADVIARLRASRYAQDQGWITMTEVAPPRVQRRFDLICINGWGSGSREVHGIEVKVTRSDFLAEMKDIAKSRHLVALCHRYWLACPPGIAQADEVPAMWGMLVIHPEQVRQAKPAMSLNPTEWLPEVWRAMLWRCHQRTTTPADVTTARNQGEAIGERRAEERHRQEITRVKRERDEIARRVDIFERATGLDMRGWCDDQRLRAIAATAQHLASQGRTQGDLDKLVDKLAAASAALAKHATEIRQATEVLTATPATAPTETAP